MYTTGKFAQLPTALRYKNALRKHFNSEHIPCSIKRISFGSETQNALSIQHHPEAVQVHSETIVPEVIPTSHVAVLMNSAVVSMSSVDQGVLDAIFPVSEPNLPRPTATDTNRSTSSHFVTKMVDIIKAGIGEMATGWKFFGDMFGDNLGQPRITDHGGHSHTSIFFY